jgi:hypothetical protein
MKIRSLGAAGLCLALAGCGAAQLAATVTRASVSAETVATLQSYCQRGAPLISIARGQNLSAKASEIAGAVGGYCDALGAGQVPATTDANTTNWLPTNLAGLAQALGLSLR